MTGMEENPYQSPANVNPTGKRPGRTIIEQLRYWVPILIVVTVGPFLCLLVITWAVFIASLLIQRLFLH
jgi:hypothetical protein